MKLGTLLILGSALAFTVSCGHKKKVAEQTTPETKVNANSLAKTELGKDGAYTCLVGKDQRLITFDQGKKRCEIHYTKFGERSQVAWAQATPTICTEVYGKIRKNIEDRGFTCTTKVDIKKPHETASR